MTDPLLSFRHPRVFGLYVVYALLHPLRENGCAQVLWNVISNSASDLVSFASSRAPLSHLFHSCHQYACVWSLVLFGHPRFRQMYDIHLTNLTKACFSLSPYRERPHFWIHSKGVVWRLAVPKQWGHGTPYSVRASILANAKESNLIDGGGSNCHGILKATSDSYNDLHSTVENGGQFFQNNSSSYL